LALALAGALAERSAPCGLVYADAMAVYRGMDIGTAKPTPPERHAVAHFGLDLVDPSEPFSVVEYQRAYHAAMAAITDRGLVPIVVGGTGLYVRAVLDGLTPPPSYPAVRATLELEPDRFALYERLQVLDPVAAARIDPTNRRRTIRALEVCLGSGRPFSTYGPGLEHYPDLTTPIIGLRWPRQALRRRIDERFAAQLAQGFLEEVVTLRARAGDRSRTSSVALGYAELGAYLDGHCSLAEATATATARIARFATRQERWFRRDPRVRWIELTDDPLEALPTALDVMQVRAIGLVPCLS
jgi:tRNA dimethylallyltransferase